MGLWDAVTGAVEDIGGAVVDVADAAANGVADAADAASDVVGGAATVVNTVTGGLAEDALELADDVVFDTVDTVTGGLVDVDYDDGVLSASAGIEGVAHAGAEVSQRGVRAQSSSLVHDKHIGLTDDGFELGVAAGIDGISDHLPYSDLDVDFGTDGDIDIETEAHGTLPTPYGIVSGKVEAGVHQNEDGFAGYLDADGQLIMTDGDVVRGNLGAAYVETEAGSQLSVDVGGSYTTASGISVGGQVGYDRLETADGTVVENLEAAASASYRGIGHTIDHQSISIEPGPASSPSTGPAAAGPTLQPNPLAPLGPAAPSFQPTAEPMPAGPPSAPEPQLPAAVEPATIEPIEVVEPSAVEQTVAATTDMSNDLDSIFDDLDGV